MLQASTVHVSYLKHLKLSSESKMKKNVHQTIRPEQFPWNSFDAGLFPVGSDAN